MNRVVLFFYHLFLNGFKIDINEKSLHKVSKLVSNFSGFRIPVNKPIVGDNVFTQTAGIHADGDNKKNLYDGRFMLGLPASTR